jgi:hypothetical protein
LVSAAIAAFQFLQPAEPHGNPMIAQQIRGNTASLDGNTTVVQNQNCSANTSGSSVTGQIIINCPQNSGASENRSIAPNSGVSFGSGAHIEQNTNGNNSPNIISGGSVKIQNNNR